MNNPELFAPKCFIANQYGYFSVRKVKFTCALGRSGMIAADQKREGDGKSPIGFWPFRKVYYRPDRLNKPETALPVYPLNFRNGWCDAPDDVNYNRLVRLPYPASAERLWRKDNLYDLIITLGHNDNPVIPVRGSAIFLHIKKDRYRPTEGCIALEKLNLLSLLKRIRRGDGLLIRQRI